MSEKTLIRSEGDQLIEVLDELQRQQQVREFTGWDSGFANLNRALDGISPGLHLIIGPPACGKTAFAKQLLDQVAKHSAQPGLFFSFSESKSELRIKTLARLSSMENRAIRRGSAYLLHWFGVPKAHYAAAEQLAPSWEKVRQSAEEAKSWLDLIYLIECERGAKLHDIEAQVRQIGASPFIVIDDCQRLGEMNQTLETRLPIVVEQLQELALNLPSPLCAVWPDFSGNSAVPAQAWAEKVASADVIMVMENDLTRTKQLTEPSHALTLHIVKSRGGERGKLAFDFYPPFCKFVELE